LSGLLTNGADSVHKMDHYPFTVDQLVDA